jgi:hypothetical protein
MTVALLFGTIPIRTASAWSSNANIELYVTGGTPAFPAYSTIWYFTTPITVTNSHPDCVPCFSVQDNVYNFWSDIDVQGVVQVYSDQVQVSVQVLTGQATNCPNPNYPSSILCVQAVTGVNPSVILAGGWPKVALVYSSNTQITGAYFAIWDKYGTMVYLQSFSYSYSDGSGFVYAESISVGLGGGSNAQFTSTSGVVEHATSSPNPAINSVNSPNVMWSSETSNMCYSSSPSGLGTYVVDQNFNSGC